MRKLAYLVFLLAIGLTFATLAHLAVADLEACTNAGTAAPTLWQTLSSRPPSGYWPYFLPLVPLAGLAIGKRTPDRGAWIAAGIILALGAWLMLPSGAVHDCDRKGSNAEFGLLMLFPAAFFLMLAVIARRSMAKAAN